MSEITVSDARGRLADVVDAARARLPARHQRLTRLREAAAVRIEDDADTLRGYRVLHLIGKGNKSATMPITVPVLRVREVCRGSAPAGHWC